MAEVSIAEADALRAARLALVLARCVQDGLLGEDVAAQLRWPFSPNVLASRVEGADPSELSRQLNELAERIRSSLPDYYVHGPSGDLVRGTPIREQGP